MPRVSIVIPTYNRADLLLLTLRSALAQTFTDREIIVIDNASTDETPEVMAQFADRVRYIRKPVNKGLVDSYNMGFREAAGDFILLLDSDDTIHPEMIARQVAYLDHNRNVDFVRVGGYYVDAAGEKFARVRFSPTGPGRQLLSSLVFGNFELCGAILYRKSTIERVGMFDECLPVYEDWDHSLRMALRDCHFGFIAEPLFFYRFHAGNSMKKVQAVEAASNIILGKLFANPDLPAEIRPLRDQAEAQAHLFLAYNYYALHMPRDAQRCLMHAWNAHPCWHSNGAALLDALLDYTLYMHLGDSLQFARFVMDQLPPQLAPLQVHEAAVISRIHLQQAFRNYDQGDLAAGVAGFEQALTADSSLVTRRKDFAVLLRKFAIQAVTEPAQFVEVVLNHLPGPAQSLKRMRNTVMADLELAAAYASLREDDRETARRLTNVLRLQPTMAGRRGVLAPLLRSLVRVI